MKEKLLFWHCRDNELEEVQSLLSDSTESYDILWKDGVILQTVIESNNYPILDALLSYYRERNLKGDHGSTEYHDRLESIISAIEDAKCSVDRESISSGTLSVIAKYISDLDEDDIAVEHHYLKPTISTSYDGYIGLTAESLKAHEKSYLSVDKLAEVNNSGEEGSTTMEQLDTVQATLDIVDPIVEVLGTIE